MTWNVRGSGSFSAHDDLSFPIARGIFPDCLGIPRTHGRTGRRRCRKPFSQRRHRDYDTPGRAQPAGIIQPGHQCLPTFPLVEGRRVRTGAFLRLIISSSNLKIRNHKMSANDGDLVDRMAKKHSVSPAAVQVVLAALRSEGAAGWPSSATPTSGGMFAVVARHVHGGRHVQHATQCQAGRALQRPRGPSGHCRKTAGGVHPEGDEVSYRSQTRSEDWWPAGLGRPAAVGAQNDLRYAVFPETRRLVIDDQGTISIYDTGSHRIFGVAQAQNADRTLTFTSQDGLVRIANLPRVSV